MTPEQKAKYLQNTNHCPFCGSDNISGQHVEVDDGGAWQNVGCDDCDKEWTDIYTLVDVEEVE